MPLLPLKALRELLAGMLVLGVAAAFPCFAQVPAPATAPTASEDPAVIDQAWQKTVIHSLGTAVGSQKVESVILLGSEAKIQSR